MLVEDAYNVAYHQFLTLELGVDKISWTKLSSEERSELRESFVKLSGEIKEVADRVWDIVWEQAP